MHFKIVRLRDGEKMDQVTLKELKQYQPLQKRLEYLSERIERIKKEISSIKSPQGESIMGGARKGLDDTLIKLEGLLSDYDSERNQVLERCQKIEENIRKINDASDQNILRYKYIKGYPWDGVGQEVNYSPKQASRRHDEMFVLRTEQDVRKCPCQM